VEQKRGDPLQGGTTFLTVLCSDWSLSTKVWGSLKNTQRSGSANDVNDDRCAEKKKRSGDAVCDASSVPSAHIKYTKTCDAPPYLRRLPKYLYIRPFPSFIPDPSLCPPYVSIGINVSIPFPSSNACRVAAPPDPPTPFLQFNV
jgi:hypothetical protein